MYLWRGEPLPCTAACISVGPRFPRAMASPAASHKRIPRSTLRPIGTANHHICGAACWVGKEVHLGLTSIPPPLQLRRLRNRPPGGSELRPLPSATRECPRLGSGLTSPGPAAAGIEEGPRRLAPALLNQSSRWQQGPARPTAAASTRADEAKAAGGKAATNACGRAAAGTIRPSPWLERVLVLAHRPPVGSPQGVSPHAVQANLTTPRACTGASHPHAGDRWEGAAATMPHAHRARNMRRRRTPQRPLGSSAERTPTAPRSRLVRPEAPRRA